MEFWNLTVIELNALIGRLQSTKEEFNYRTALICAVIANTARDPKRKPRAFTPEDFMPVKKSKRQTSKQMFANVLMLNAVYGGKVLEN